MPTCAVPVRCTRSGLVARWLGACRRCRRCTRVVGILLQWRHSHCVCSALCVSMSGQMISYAMICPRSRSVLSFQRMSAPSVRGPRIPSIGPGVIPTSSSAVWINPTSTLGAGKALEVHASASCFSAVGEEQRAAAARRWRAPAPVRSVASRAWSSRAALDDCEACGGEYDHCSRNSVPIRAREPEAVSFAHCVPLYSSRVARPSRWAAWAFPSSASA